MSVTATKTLTTNSTKKTTKTVTVEAQSYHGIQYL